MARLFRSSVALLGALLICACAEKWTKPGASDADFQAVKAACNARATALFPPDVEQVIVADSPQAPAPSSNCGMGSSDGMMGGGMMQDCAMTNNLNLPTQTMVDQNAASRTADARNCLLASGWRPAKSN